MQRVVESAYKEIYDKIYDDYASYPEPMGRTKKILESVKDKIPSPKRVLDIGAGQGDGMRVMKEFFPDSIVFGYEPTINPERPNDKFDLITLFHVLEHVEDLHEMLDYIKSSLTDNGHVLIQVPYTAMWPFDLVLADHWWHFDIQAIVLLLNNNGFNVKYFGNNPIKKEITVLASVGESVGFPKSNTSSYSHKSIDWLLSYKSFLNSINEEVIVMGTGPAAAWTGSILGNKVLFYIDDDISRQTKFNNREVYGIYYKGENRIGKQFPVVAPFPEWQLQEIKTKHPGLRFL